MESNHNTAACGSRPAPFSPHSVFRFSHYGLWCVSLWRISAIPVNKWTGEMPAIVWALAGTMLAVRPHDGYSLMIHLMPFGSRLQSLEGFTPRYWSKKTNRQETKRLRTILNLVGDQNWSLSYHLLSGWAYASFVSPCGALVAAKQCFFLQFSSSPRMMEWFL